MRVLDIDALIKASGLRPDLGEVPSAAGYICERVRAALDQETVIVELSDDQASSVAPMRARMGLASAIDGELDAAEKAGHRVAIRCITLRGPGLPDDFSFRRRDAPS